MSTAMSAPRIARIVRWLVVSLVLVALGQVAAQCVDVPALGSERSVDVGDTACVASRLASDGRHTVEFDLVVPGAGRVHDLVLDAPDATALEVCVRVAGELTCQAADADGVRFVDLLPQTGTVRVRATLRGDAGQAFRASLEDRGAPQPGFAYEPNDHIATATLLGDDLTVRGRFQGRNVDVLRVEIAGEPQLWRVQVLGPTVDQLNLLAASGRAQQTRTPESGDRGVRMSNLYLLPGPHHFSVRGSDGEYALRLIPLGPADEPRSEATAATPVERATQSLGTPTAPRESAAAAAVEIPLPTGPRPEGQMEREPNDDARTASLLRPGEPWVGLLADPGDVDVYRFYLGEDGPVRLTATPPEGLALVVRIDGGGRIDVEPGEPFVLERWFLAGDHAIALSASESVDGYYQVLLERLDPFALDDLPRPHGELWRARELPAHHEVRAVLERTAYVRLPELPTPTTLTVEVVEGAERVHPFSTYTPTGSNVARFSGRRDDGIYVAELPAGGPYLVRLDGGGHAHLRFTFDDAGPAAQPRPEEPPVTLSLHGTRDVAAYHPYAQRFDLELEIRNDGARPLELTLDTHVTDHGWRLTPREATVSVAAGDTRRVALEGSVDPVARDDLPVDLTVAVRAADGGVASVMASATAVCGAPLVGGAHAFGVPQPLLGGINVAWTNLGADVPSGARREFMLYDGLTPPAGGWLGGVDEHTTVRLAGDGTPRVVGVLLHPLSSADVLARLGDFEIQTSLDGSSFTTVYQGRLRSPDVEQAFAFEEGVAARYVRLVALSNQDGNPRGNTGLGQFKVIAEPGARVLGDRVDLGLREHGGHVAAALPHVSSYELTTVSQRGSPTTFRLDHGQDTVWWVHAFHHNRAALLDGLTWSAHPGASGASGERIADVTVSVSLDSPIGPWTEVGTWRPEETSEWRFEAPRWARFVRFEAHFPDADRPTVVLPDRIGLLEHPEGPEYRSVLGEWGHYARDGAFEWRHPPSVAAIVSGGDHATRDRAAQLSAGETIATHVLVGEYDAWFSFEVPAASNFARLELLGDPTVDYRYSLTDANGAPVVADVRVAPERIEIEGFLEPGRYFVHAWEPLRNVVFSWDDSGSMGPYVDATMQTVFGFARDVDPERELVQLQVFARDPYFLLDEWSGRPIEVLRSVLDYPRDEGSSDAEGNLAFVVQQLAAREGTRAVFFVTDAESSPGPRNVTPLWEAFLEAPAKVFAFETSSAGSDDTQDRMQTFADVAGGFYDYSRTIGDLDVAFARASCLLRQPKTVGVALQLETRDPPGPGALAVRRPALDPAEQEAARPAVHVIYDASGSMGQLIPDGSASRVAVARQVLTRLVDEVIEPGTPFALRAYGHVSPMTCDTALVHPLAPLERSAARAAVASVEPKLLSGTPLAASIEAVASDLAGATGPKTVILLTDGEETCGGDPEAAIRTLVGQGIGVQLSIIGFDVDTDDAAAMRANFAAWAELGGGIFLEAFDAGELREALEAALYAEVEVRFEVLDGDGSVVAIGVVDGDAVPLPAGRYALRVIGADAALIDEVIVRHEATTHLVLDGE